MYITVGVDANPVDAGDNTGTLSVALAPGAGRELLGVELPPAVGLWWVHALLLVVALVWLQRQGRSVGKG